MARSISGLFGNFSGKIGNLVVYQIYGKTVVRSRPSIKHKPATGKRKQYQDDFSYIMKLMQATSAYIKIGFKDAAINSTAFRKALSLNLKTYREQQRPATLDWLILSMGNRAQAQNLQLTFLSKTQIQINWGQAIEGHPFSDKDSIIAMVINEKTLSSTTSFYKVKREDLSLMLDAPTCENGESLICFISFINPYYSSKRDLNNVSISINAVLSI